MRRFLSLFLLVFCLPCTTLASEPIQIGPDIKFLNIGRHADVFLDPTHKLALADIVSDEYSSRFHPHTTRGFNFGMINDVIWLRFKLNILPGRREADGLLLGLDKTTFPYVTLHLPTSPETYTPINGSYLNRTGNQTLKYRYPVFKIPYHLPPDRYIYMSIAPSNAKQHSSSNFNLFLSDTDGFIHRTWAETSFYYLIFGVLLSMIAYNLFLSFFLKDRVYYFYVGYVAFILIYIFLRSGFHLVAGFPALTNLILPVVAVAYLLGIIFSQSFLATAQYCPVIHRLMWGIMGSAGVVLVAQGLGFPKLANSLMHIIGAGGPIVAIAAGFIRLHQGYKPARYYLAAWLSLLTGVISLSLVGLGVLPKKFFIFNFMAIGSMLEAVLLSTALGDRIRVLRQEKRELQKKERRLIELSITDELTGLFNKRWFSSKFQSEIRHSKRVSHPLSLIILDVDRFKDFNDTYGHAAGDKVLAKLGAIIIEGLREGDIGCRYGGEEFAVILPATDIDKAFGVAERLRRRFESSDIDIDSGKKVHSTISLGAGQLEAGENESQLFEKTDRALYLAKQKGRNRTETAGDQLKPGRP